MAPNTTYVPFSWKFLSSSVRLHALALSVWYMGARLPIYQVYHNIGTCSRNCLRSSLRNGRNCTGNASTSSPFMNEKFNLWTIGEKIISHPHQSLRVSTTNASISVIMSLWHSSVTSLQEYVTLWHDHGKISLNYVRCDIAMSVLT
jgi:hypothetical protein